MRFCDVNKHLNLEYKIRQDIAQNKFNDRLADAMKNKEFYKLYKERNKLIEKKANYEISNKDTSNVNAELALVSRRLLSCIEVYGIDLNMYYKCPKCKDTGFINFQECECRNRKRISLNRSLSGLPRISVAATLDSSIFKKNNTPQSSFMQKVYTKIKEWVNNFDNSDKNIVFMSGEVGIGKTHLAYAVSNELLSKGKTIMYLSAFGMNEVFVNEKFNRDETEIYERILEADLLIFDDLGVESINSITLEYLLGVIETRLSSGMKIFVTTNLTIEKFKERYGERLASRLTNTKTSFAPKYITGQDLRKL